METGDLHGKPEILKTFIFRTFKNLQTMKAAIDITVFMIHTCFIVS